jgi:hypothetical protein
MYSIEAFDLPSKVWYSSCLLCYRDLCSLTTKKLYRNGHNSAEKPFMLRIKVTMTVQPFVGSSYTCCC